MKHTVPKIASQRFHGRDKKHMCPGSDIAQGAEGRFKASVLLTLS